MIAHLDAWALRRLLCGLAVNGELQGVSRPFQKIALHLDGISLEARPVALEGFLASRDDRTEINLSLAAADPEGPAPEVEPAARFATLADIARIISDQQALWKGWINKGVLNVVAADPGIGKTRFAFDLAYRLWFGLDWPDGQPNPFPKGSRTFWIQGDRNFAEMLALAQEFGLPPEAVVLCSSPDDPTGSLDLDDPETLEAIAERIRAADPALVIIDTVGMVTDRNLGRPEEARAFFAPLIEMAAKSEVAFLGLTHLSANKEALGRRIVEKARIVIKMTQPDPDGQPNRRRLWVDKTAGVKPPPLGITMGTGGNQYDFNPPSEPDPNKGGRPPEQKDKAASFILESLAKINDRIGNELRAEWEATGGNPKTFWRAVEELEAAGRLTIDGGLGTRKQKTLHLNPADPGPETPSEDETEPSNP